MNEINFTISAAEKSYSERKKQMPARLRTNSEAGFTLVELLVVAVILGMLAALAIPTYARLIAKVKVARSISEIRSMEKSIIASAVDKQYYPNSLNEVGFGDLKDPWDNSYRYSNIEGGGAARQSMFLADLNTDFDVYSTGPDGLTTQVVSDPEGLDDVVRASDGGWVGIGADY